MLLCTYAKKFMVQVPFTPVQVYAHRFTWGGFRFHVCNHLDIASLAIYKGDFQGPPLLTLIT